MSVRFTKLRIAGFKSFAEPVSLDILPGLTGIVGPNGCGKSNVVEALRWAMGETSARSLRGGEMDDVIFAGTTARASRNLAEVAVTLEAAAGMLPAPFEAEAELQVTRRLERGAGSVFRVNGREVRARDVQTLYADLASGARSSGMVSQGRVADLVRARPEDRRSVLEEAAGITGLHARRSEAELKLRAAEQNLARAEDLHTQLDGTREGLCGQARQAARYRAISGLIRAAEAEHLGILHGQAAAALQAAQEDEALASQAVRHASATEQEATEALAGAEAHLPGPRGEEAAARTILERRRLQAETLGEEAARATREADEAASRLRDLASDLAHSEEARADAAATMERLGAEQQRQAARLASLPGLAAQAVAASVRAREAAAAAQTASDEAARLASVRAAASQQASHARHRAHERLAALQASQAALAREHAEASATLIGTETLAGARAVLSEAEAALTTARAAVEQAETARNAAVAAALAQRAQAERANDARRAAEQLARDAAERTTRQQSVCQAARTALAVCEAARIPAGQVSAADASAESASAVLAELEDQVSSAGHAAEIAQDKAAAAKIAADDGRAWLARAQATLSAALARADRLADELAAAEAALVEAEQAALPASGLSALQAAHEVAEQAQTLRAADWLRAEDAREAASRHMAQARSALALCEAHHTRLEAEANGRRAGLGEDSDDGALAALHVPDGLQAAVGAALGELGRASLDISAPCFWRALPDLAPAALPDGSVALSSLVAAPAALGRVLSHVALLDDAADGSAVQADLAPGMIAVNRAGACWRWDGHVRREGAPNWAAARLDLRSKLSATRDRLAQAAEAVAEARLCHNAAEADQAAAEATADAALSACRSAEGALSAAAQAVERAAALSAQAGARLATVQPSTERLRDAHRAATIVAEEARQAVAVRSDQASLEQAHDAAATLAKAAALALEQARGARADARVAEDQARNAARALSATAHAAQAQVSAAAPALARAEAELAAVRDAERGAQAARLALPDVTGLQSAADRADAEERAARRSAAVACCRRDEAESALDQARQDHARLHGAHLQAEWQVAALSDRLGRCQAELDAADDAVAQADALAGALPDPRVSETAAGAARLASEQARQIAGAAEVEAAALQAELGHAERTLGGLAAELDGWARRLEEAAARHAGLAERTEAARRAWPALEARPMEASERAARSGEALAEAEAGYAASAATLADAERAVRDRSAALREAALAAGMARDRQIRAEASRLAAARAVQAMLARAAERLDGAALPPAADRSAAAEERAGRKFERLSREREAMGPVNLRAEIELEALDGRIGALERQRAEVAATIAKLRGAIGTLNREGRERLTAVFTQVDQHFRALFTRMMGGGRAHLALAGSDDPLLAGLEIYAEPPGKKLSALSLLSGGEQALTALSLIFAVFRCTPAPLCVLDEVDAPLDDANVERFCTLLDDVVRDTGTSFLVVTHHQLTMSRMDRLFGVTMQERGVSRLLSVDLRRAAAMTEPLLQAAE